jgi:N utilization substance protein A
VSSTIKEAFHQLARERNITVPALKDALEAAVLAAYKKDPHVTQNAEVDYDIDNGTWKVWAHKVIVEDVADAQEEISLADAKAFRDDAQVDETIAFDVTPKDFGRLAAQMAKQVITQRLRESERKILYDEFKDKEGATVIGTVQRVEGRNIIINLGKIEALLPGSEQLPGERPRVGERIKVFIAEVRDTPRGVQVIASRAHEGLVRELFELEVPEVLEGSVIIEGISREAGHRTKIAVRSRDTAIDPIGACVGARGGRIQAISQELRNEKIEIIRFSPVLETYIANSLSPAKVASVEIFEEHRAALVIVPDTMLSLAIGREGQNVRLAAKLTGYRIDIKSETQIADLERQREEDEEYYAAQAALHADEDGNAPEGAEPVHVEAPQDGEVTDGGTEEVHAGKA